MLFLGADNTFIVVSLIGSEKIKQIPVFHAFEQRRQIPKSRTINMPQTQ